MINDGLKPFISANYEMACGNDKVLDKLLSSLNDATVTSRVKQAIISKLPSGAPTDDDVAVTLHMSSRTLSRRLTDEHTTFRDLVTSVRRDLAKEYIADPNVPITEISYLLGFSDLSSFSRAFKSWNGDSPKVFRNNLASG